MTIRLRRKERNVRVREVRAGYVTVPRPSEPITSPANIAAIANAWFGTVDDPQENLIVLYLNARHRLLAVEAVYRGSLAQATVGTRDLVRNALVLHAAAIAIVHNHPGGDPAPSADDVHFTHQVRRATQLFAIELVDHVVLGYTATGELRYQSIKEMGLL
jgi:DNA repair protein RadC